MANRPGVGPRLSRTRSIWLSGLLLLTLALVYAPSFSFPFVQDDWERLESAAFHSSASATARAMPARLVLYRPLTSAYHLWMYRLFGLRPTAFHLVNLLLLWAGSLLLVGLLLGLTRRDATLAWCSVFLYASATPVFMEPMFWMAGVEPLAASLFALAAALLVLRGHEWLALVPLTLAVLFWETAIFVPLVPITFLALEPQEAPRAERGQRVLRALWPYGSFVIVYGALRLALTTPVVADPADPYYLALTGPHLWKNLVSYGLWGLESLLPVKGVVDVGPLAGQLSSWPARSSWLVYVLWLGALAAALLLRRAKSASRPPLLLLLLWAVCGIAPVFFLANHTYRYYLAFALAPLAVWFVALLRRLIGAVVGQRGLLAESLLVAYVLAGVVSSALYLRGRTAEGLSQTQIFGTNMLVRRAATVELVRDGLLRLLPHPPPGSTLLFQGVDIWSFDRSSGPRVWYGDRAITVYDARFAVPDRDGIAIVGAPERQAEIYLGVGSSRRRHLDPAKTFLFALQDRRLVELPLSHLAPGPDATIR